MVRLKTFNLMDTEWQSSSSQKQYQNYNKNAILSRFKTQVCIMRMHVHMY